jgi:GNAT superfamily N-acetyltransferase
MADAAKRPVTYFIFPTPWYQQRGKRRGSRDFPAGSAGRRTWQERRDFVREKDVPMAGRHIQIHEVGVWDTGEIVALYRAGGWWDDERDSPEEIPALILGSLAFVVATDTSTGKAVGMGRVISDGVSDGYVQDLVVFPEYRGRGMGSAIVRALIAACRRHGIRWLALIAEPGSDQFYGDLGFAMDAGDMPMRYCGDLSDDQGQ